VDPNRLSLGCGEKRVLDVRGSASVTLANAGTVPVRVRLSRRSGADWVPFCADLHLEPGARWSRGAAEIRCTNLVVEVVCCAPPEAVRVHF
jgi:hypothetical protein